MRLAIGFLVSGISVGAQAGTLETMESVRPLRSLRMARSPAEPPVSSYLKSESSPISGIERVAGTTAKAWGVSVMKVPIEAVWMAINDESRMAGRLPVSISTVIEGEVRKAPRRIFEYMPLPIVSDRWWVVDVEHNSKLYQESEGKVWEMTWTDATGTASFEDGAVKEAARAGYPVDWTYGSWFLVDLGEGRTLVEYYTWSDPGGNIPAGASRFAGGAVRQTLSAIEELAIEGENRSRSGFVRPDGTPL